MLNINLINNKSNPFNDFMEMFDISPDMVWTRLKTKSEKIIYKDSEKSVDNFALFYNNDIDDPTHKIIEFTVPQNMFLQEYDEMLKDFFVKKQTEILNKYLSSLEIHGKSPQTIEQYQMHITAFINFVKKPMDFWSQDDFNEYVAELNRAYIKRKKGTKKYKNLSNPQIMLAKKTIRQRQNILRAYLNYCLQTKAIKELPIIFPSMKEEKKFIKNMPGKKWRDTKRILIEYINSLPHKYNQMGWIMFQNGLRCSEVRKIKNFDIDFASSKFTVHGKGGKDRTIALAARVKRVIHNYIITELMNLDRKKGETAVDALYRIRGYVAKELMVRMLDYIKATIGKIPIEPQLVDRLKGEGLHDLTKIVPFNVVRDRFGAMGISLPDIMSLTKELKNLGAIKIIKLVEEKDSVEDDLDADFLFITRGKTMSNRSVRLFMFIELLDENWKPAERLVKLPADKHRLYFMIYTHNISLLYQPKIEDKQIMNADVVKDEFLHDKTLIISAMDLDFRKELKATHKITPGMKAQLKIIYDLKEKYGLSQDLWSQNLFMTKFGTPYLKNGTIVTEFERTFERGEFRKKYNIPQITSHWLRAWGATLRSIYGMKLEVEQDFLGHNDPGTTRIYTDVPFEKMDQQVIASDFMVDEIEDWLY